MREMMAAAIGQWAALRRGHIDTVVRGSFKVSVGCKSVAYRAVFGGSGAIRPVGYRALRPYIGLRATIYSTAYSTTAATAAGAWISTAGHMMPNVSAANSSRTSNGMRSFST